MTSSSHDHYVKRYYAPGGQRDQNEESRHTAQREGLRYSVDEYELIMEWDQSEEELTVLAELLERSREACRQRYYSIQRGDAPPPVEHREEPRIGRTGTRSVTTTTTTTTTYHYSNWSEDDMSEWYA